MLDRYTRQSGTKRPLAHAPPHVRCVRRGAQCGQATSGKAAAAVGGTRPSRGLGEEGGDLRSQSIPPIQERGAMPPRSKSVSGHCHEVKNLRGSSGASTYQARAAAFRAPHFPCPGWTRGHEARKHNRTYYECSSSVCVWFGPRELNVLKPCVSRTSAASLDTRPSVLCLLAALPASLALVALVLQVPPTTPPRLVD
jgi:hypothetical protein